VFGDDHWCEECSNRRMVEESLPKGSTSRRTARKPRTSKSRPPQRHS
jgi:hypothetical protein